MILRKKFHVVALIATMMALGVQASPVSSNDVLKAVAAWSSANGATFGNEGSPVSAKAVYSDDGTVVLYWLVQMPGGKAIVASPDSDLDLVVSVIENFGGEFPAGHPLPSILKADMSKRLAAIAKKPQGISVRGGRTASTQSALPSDVSASIAKANAQWAKYGVGSSGGMRLMAESLEGGDASPYVRNIVDGFEEGGRFTHWNQEFDDYVSPKRLCYNKYTPGNSVCGCVATAGSAILQFFNCTNDIGTVKKNPSYLGEAAPAQFCTTRPGALDWTILPKRLGGQKEGSDLLDDAGYDLIGRVAFNMGVLVEMSWASEGPGSESGAFTRSLVDAFKEYGFTTARYVRFDTSKEADNENQFTKTVYAQNWCGAPVVLGIAGTVGGHAVIACGYARDPDGDQFCRVFMGWGGAADAWYKFPDVSSFNIVDEAVTMIGYQDDAVIPVYGSANIPGVDLEIPGYEVDGVPVTAPVNANGYFGVRVSPSVPDLRIGYEPRDKYAPINPFDKAVVEDESSTRENLDAALPDEINLSVLNTDVRYTLESGKAIAQRDGKALLLVSGTAGGLRSNALMEYIYWLDETTEMSNRYVLVYNNVRSKDGNRADGDPSIGVFDPNLFDPKERWTASNGRLSYENFIDEEADMLEAGGVVYTFSETNMVAVTNAVIPMMDVGYDSYLRNNSGITVTIAGVEPVSETNTIPCNIGAAYPGYGVSANSWTNGERVVFSVPASVTNEAEGVVRSCVGWTTDEIEEGKEITGLVEGNEAEFTLASGDTLNLTWIWEPSHFLVTAAADRGGAGFDTAVTPKSFWAADGDIVTVSAEGKVGSWGFNGWEVRGTEGVYEELAGDYWYEENSTKVSFSVSGKIEVTASYRNGNSAPAAPRAYSFTVKASPAELQPILPAPAGLEWGANTGYSYLVSLRFPVESVIDADGTEWVCKGWSTASGDDPEASTIAPATGEIVAVWERALVLEPIEITSIAQEADGSWTVAVSGAKAGGWYWIYSADDPAKFAGDEAQWTSQAEVATLADGANPKQATADGTIEFKLPASAAQSRFWRARGTVTEDGK